MSAPFGYDSVEGILLDVEGTTTPMDFVFRVLFPHARAHAAEFLSRHRSSTGMLGDIMALLNQHTQDVAAGLNPPLLHGSTKEAQIESVAAYVRWLMDHDRKVTALKSLQGKIWEAGYKSGELQGAVFEDVPAALARWSQQGKQVRIFSSGSVLAQRLLFAHSTEGDLTEYISGYFDTTTGAKSDPQSYKRIARAARQDPSALLFISDVEGELKAAAAAGMRVLLCIRPGNRAQAPMPETMAIRTFDGLFPSA